MNKISNSFKIQKILKESQLLCQNGKIDEAKPLLQGLLKSMPSHPVVLSNLGSIELQQRNFDIGIEYLEKSLKANPKQPQIICNLANGYLDSGKASKSIEYYDLAISLNPSSFEFFYNRARAKKIMKDYVGAIDDYKTSIKLNQNYFLAIFNLGFLFNEIKHFDLALEQYQKAIILNSSNPEIYYNRGIVYENMKKNHEAIYDLNKAIELNPRFKEAYTKRGNIKFGEQDLEGALEDYSQSIKLDINSYEAMFNMSIICLIRNNFQEGWKLYETRWEFQKYSKKLVTSKPLLIDFNVKRAKIFIWAEQGLGDQIIYSSLLIDALKTNNYFYVSLDSRLLSLFKRSFSWVKNIEFISSDDTIDESQYDLHLPLGSLGSFFRKNIQDFKEHPISYLKVNKDLVSGLKRKLTHGKKICGISWFSKNLEIGPEKSLSLIQLLPILSLKNITFVDLQYGDTSHEREILLNDYGIEIQKITEIDNFSDIDGLASLIEACDFVITTSNVTAHIAGAINKKTYLLLSYNCGKIWYWGNAESNSLWYPSIEIFKDDETVSWKKPIESLLLKLTHE